MSYTGGGPGNEQYDQGLGKQPLGYGAGEGHPGYGSGNRQPRYGEGRQPEGPPQPWFVGIAQRPQGFIIASLIIGFILGIFIYAVAAQAVPKPLASLVGLTVFLAGPIIYFYAEHQNGRLEDTRRKAASEAEAKRAAAAFAAHQQWLAGRPLHAILAARSPLTAAREMVARYNGTAYLGIEPDTQDFYVLARNQSVIVVGMAQSGKTTGINNPSIIAAPGPVVAASSKLDIFNDTIPSRRTLGRCWYFDVTNSIDTRNLEQGLERAYWSPLWDVTTYTQAIFIAMSAVGAAIAGEGSSGNDKHWRITAEDLLAPLFFAASLHQDANIATVREWLQNNNYVPASAILLAVMEDSSHPLAEDATAASNDLAGFLSDGDARHMAGVRSTALTALSAYRFPAVIRDANRHNFDVDAFVRSTDTLYIAANAQTQEAVAPIVACLIDAIYQANSRLEHVQPFAANTRPPLFVALDEAANISPSPKIPQYLSEGPGQGFQLMLHFQTLAQAVKVWPSYGRSILDLPAVKIIFGGQSDRDTLEAFSALAGDYDRVYRQSSDTFSYAVSNSTSRGSNWSMSGSGSSKGETFGNSSTSSQGSSTSIRKERRFSPADVSTLKPYHALIIAGSTWKVATMAGTTHPSWRAAITDLEVPGIYAASPGQLARKVPDLDSLTNLVFNMTYEAPQVDLTAQEAKKDISQ